MVTGGSWTSCVLGCSTHTLPVSSVSSALDATFNNVYDRRIGDKGKYCLCCSVQSGDIMGIDTSDRMMYGSYFIMVCTVRCQETVWLLLHSHAQVPGLVNFSVKKSITYCTNTVIY